MNITIPDNFIGTLREDVQQFLEWWDKNAGRFPDLSCEMRSWGLLWMRTKDSGVSRMVPVLEVRPMRDGRWVVLCLKYSHTPYSRNVFSYGGLFIKDTDDTMTRFEDALRFLEQGFSPSQRPVTVRKTLRIDLKELHETGQEDFSL